MTTSRIAALQDRAQRRIALANPLVEEALREVYTVELLVAEHEEEQQEAMRRFEQAKVADELLARLVFWQEKAHALEVEVARMKGDSSPVFRALTDEEAQRILKICEGHKPSRQL